MDQVTSKSTIPTETIELPSRGLLYPKNNPLSSGTIEMKYMTAKEEDILTNSNYLKQGTAVDKLLQSMIVSKINFDDLLVGDKNAVLIAARVLGYGKDYEFNYYYGGEVKQGKVDLTSLKDKTLDPSLLISEGVNEFKFDFSTSNNKITFKLLTHGDEKKIEAELKGIRKIKPDASPEITTRLKYMITSVNGDRTNEAIRDFVDNNLIAKDSRELRKYYSSISPNVELKYYPEGSEEAIEIPIGTNFFWPDAGI
jgi:hypothetical protein